MSEDGGGSVERDDLVLHSQLGRSFGAWQSQSQQKLSATVKVWLWSDRPGFHSKFD